MAIVIPTHTHSVIDVDRPFVINPSTKEITAETEKLTLAQHSKDSERFTFTIPDTSIEGHDMSKCNSVKIHFENIGQEPGQISAGIYTVTDLAVADSRVTLSWLIGEDATRYTGGLIFSIHFGCLTADGSLVYNLPTLTYSKITVGATVWHSDTISREYPDIITEFEDRISSLEDTVVRCTKQHFPEEKKAQARDNIGAADSAFVGDSAAALDAIIEMQEALLNASGTLPDDYGTPYAVEYIKQKLTEVAKAQARENIGAAPAGYGLGTQNPSRLTTLFEVDNAGHSGWYEVRLNGENIEGLTHGLLYVNASTLVIEQVFLPYVSLCKLVRYWNVDYGWGPWEWDNPLMADNVEYRTTERWLGRAVYTKVVNVGAFPAEGSRVHFGLFDTPMARILRVNGAFGNRGVPVPYVDTEAAIHISGTVYEGVPYVVLYVEKGDFTDDTCIAQVWYVKE